MTWFIWAKNIFEMLGALATLAYMGGKFLNFSVKLYVMVSEKKLKVNGNHKRTDMERVFHERDE